MLQIVQAYDRSPIAQVATDDADGLEAKLDLAVRAFRDRDHTAFRTDWMPFAGRRQSGYGIGGIPWSMHEMTEEKMVVLRHAY
jgi:hypothetical protein